MVSRRSARTVIGTALALTLLMPVMQAGAATDPLLNEFVFNHVDIDIAEFAEVAGTRRPTTARSR